MLHTLAKGNHAPKMFRQISQQHVPTFGIIASVAVMLAGVVVNYFVPKQAFVYVISIVVVIELWTWSIIIISHLGYRRALAASRVTASPYKMPLAPVSGYLTLAFFALILVLLAFDDDTRIALYVTPIWVGLMAIGWYFVKARPVEG
jgi:AAT family amino acid transporter/D-serine/D-alanine/glycine transporter